MRVGVVGAGYWGTKVVREYLDLRASGDVDKVWVCDTSPKALAAAKTLGRLDGTTTTVAQLLRNVDAIHIATRNEFHHPIARQALEAGVHLMVEKPMTLSSKHAYDLVELASTHGLMLKVGHIYRFNNAIRRLQELIKKGHFGAVHYYKFQWTTRMPSPEGLDILWDLLPHPLDMIHYLDGEWPESFTGVARSYRRKGPAEVAFLEAAYSGNRVAAMELSWLRPIRSRTLEIVGEKRDAIVDCVAQTIEVVTDGDAKPEKVKPNNTLRDEILNFIESVEKGKNPFNSAIVGARNVEAVESALRSMK